MDAINAQLEEVRRHHSMAHLEASSGHRVLVVPDLRLPSGWCKETATVRVLVPAGYPHVKPDCFFTEATLRLATGAEPASSNLQAVLGGQYRWFSWHLAAWDPVNGSLAQYVRFCQQRLREVR